MKTELKDHGSMETSLKFFSRVVSFLNISVERNQLGRNLHSTMLAAEHDPRNLVNTFLNSIGYGFVDDLIKELRNKCLMIIQCSLNSMCLCHQTVVHYLTRMSDTLNRKSVDVASLISVSEQELEASEFFIEFDETYMALQECVKLEVKNKIISVELKSLDAYDHS